MGRRLAQAWWQWQAWCRVRRQGDRAWAWVWATWEGDGAGVRALAATQQGPLRLNDAQWLWCVQAAVRGMPWKAVLAVQPPSDLNRALDSKGQSALHLLATRGYVAALQELLEAGAWSGQRDNQGKTAFDCVLEALRANPGEAAWREAAERLWAWQDRPASRRAPTVEDLAWQVPLEPRWLDRACPTPAALTGPRGHVALRLREASTPEAAALFIGWLNRRCPAWPGTCGPEGGIWESAVRSSLWSRHALAIVAVVAAHCPPPALGLARAWLEPKPDLWPAWPLDVFADPERWFNTTPLEEIRAVSAYFQDTHAEQVRRGEGSMRWLETLASTWSAYALGQGLPAAQSEKARHRF